MELTAVRPAYFSGGKWGHRIFKKISPCVIWPSAGIGLRFDSSLPGPPCFFTPILSRPISNMDSWLKESGAVGLDSLELADFPDTGRGVKTLRSFKEGEKILTIPAGILWTVKHAHADPLLGPALRSAQPPLSAEDTLAIYLLFVKSRESGYDGQRSHVAALPASYSSSVLFEEDELEVCAGSSLHTITKQLEQSIEDDHRSLVVRLFVQHPDLFLLDKFGIDDVGATHV